MNFNILSSKKKEAIQLSFSKTNILSWLSCFQDLVFSCIHVFYKQPSCQRSNVKKNFGWALSKKFYIFSFIFIEAKFLCSCFWHSLIISKQAIKLTHILKVKFRMKTRFHSRKKCSLYSLNIYSVQDKFLKITVSKFLNFLNNS